MRRILTVLLVACATAAGVLAWLHDGDVVGAVQPLIAGDAASGGELVHPPPTR